MQVLPRSLLCFSILFSVATVLPANADNGVLGVIQKKYVLTEFTPDHAQVTKDGTTMSLKCAGVYSMPAIELMSSPPDNKVVDGKVQAPNMMKKLTLTKFGAHVLQTGDKVYITKIEAKNEPGDDLLRFTILTVDAHDVTGQDSQKKFDAILSYQFKKGYLNETPPEEVEAAIEAVMAPDSGADEAQGGDSGGQPQQNQQASRQAAPPPARPAVAAPQPAPAPQAAPAPVQPAPAVPAAAPPTISVGESSTQVLQALGMPTQMIDLGKKKTFIYKSLNMKIIFMDDKVSDVQ